MAICRAILKQPAILLLDEPTSALDALTEEKVQDAISHAKRGRTTIAGRASAGDGDECRSNSGVGRRSGGGVGES